MPPEQTQNQYIEAAKLNDISEELRQLREDPSRFDEQALRQAFRDRLAKATGKKEMNNKEFWRYQEALRKIDDNIARLREMRDYIVSRSRMVLVEKYVRAKGLPQDMPAGVRYVVYSMDYQDLVAFISARPLLSVASAEYLKDIDRARGLLQDVGRLMVGYYREKFKTIGRDEEKKVRTIVQRIDEQDENGAGGQTEAGFLPLVEFMELSDSVEDLAELLRDKGQTIDKWGPKNASLDALAEKNMTRLLEMGRLLVAAREYLNNEDRAVVERFDRAMARTGAGALSEQEEASYARAVLVNKQQADRQRLFALASNPDQSVYSEAELLMKQAEKLARSNPAEAQRLYLQARDRYQQSNRVYLARRTKENNKKPPETRLARS